MKTLTRPILLASLLAAFGGSTPATATIVTLDEFDGPVGGQSIALVDAAIHESAQSLVSGTGAVGDARQILLGVFATTGGSSLLEASVNGSGTAGALEVSQSAGIQSRTVIIYNGGGAGLDLDLAGLTSLTLQGVSVDQPTLISFTTDAPAFGGGMVSSGHSAYLPAGFSGDVTVDGVYFEGNLAQVFRVQIDVVFQTAGGRLRADGLAASVEAIPEPATALMLGGGLAGLTSRRRRRAVRGLGVANERARPTP